MSQAPVAVGLTDRSAELLLRLAARWRANGGEESALRRAVAGTAAERLLFGESGTGLPPRRFGDARASEQPSTAPDLASQADGRQADTEGVSVHVRADLPSLQSDAQPAAAAVTQSAHQGLPNLADASPRVPDNVVPPTPADLPPLAEQRIPVVPTPEDGSL